MPVTRRDLVGGRNGMADSTPLGHVNTHAFLFGEDFDKPNEKPQASYHQHADVAENEDDQFPVLPRGGSMQFTGALGVADDSYDQQSKKRVLSRRSLPVHTGFATSTDQQFDDSPPHAAPKSSAHVTPVKGNAVNRHSLGSRLGLATEASLESPTGPPNGPSHIQPKLQSSHSTSSIPTVNNANPKGSQSNIVTTPEQRLHQHNVSLGRIPPGAIGSSRQSRESHTSSSQPDGQSNGLPTVDSVLDANNTAASGLSGSAAPFGSSHTSTSAEGQPGSSQGYGNEAMYGGYGVAPNGYSALEGALPNLSLGGGSPQWSSPTAPYGAPYSLFTSPFTPPRQADSQARIIQRRRRNSEDLSSRFYDMPLENLQGEIISLCKDQHGCRFLQKRLEEDKPEQTNMIFDETKGHMIDLMTDPFGNYLCQKLLEQTTPDQHTVLIHNAAPQMVKIALNQHGTRALQKMIEYVMLPQQISDIVNALKDHVVPMIQDLNGNHVIQKCLNHIKGNNLQFIIDSVSDSCYTVGTHRHGCCVIQRCVDHATGSQKAQLVQAINDEALRLVEDPFGNYVLQYIFDTHVDAFTIPLSHRFLGRLHALSAQKFSSNVIEKCLRVADKATKHTMIDELLGSPNFEKLVDHGYGNYVCQTAWEYAEVEDEERLAERIRPVLPRMRQRPYYRRYQARMADRDRRLGVSESVTPVEISPESVSFGSSSSQRGHEGSTLQSLHSGLGSSTGFGGPGFGYGSTSNFGGNTPQGFANVGTYHNLHAYGGGSDFGGRPSSHSNRFQNSGAPPPSFPDLSQMNQAQQYAPTAYSSYANVQPYGGGPPAFY